MRCVYDLNHKMSLENGNSRYLSLYFIAGLHMTLSSYIEE